MSIPIWFEEATKDERIVNLAWLEPRVEALQYRKVEAESVMEAYPVIV
jgi:hypothetical protein